MALLLKQMPQQVCSQSEAKASKLLELLFWLAHQLVGWTRGQREVCTHGNAHMILSLVTLLSMLSGCLLIKSGSLAKLKDHLACTPPPEQSKTGVHQLAF